MNEMPIQNDHLPADHQDAGNVPIERDDFGKASPPPVFGKPLDEPVQEKEEASVGKIMDFFEALRVMNLGVRVTKMSWENPEIFGVMKDSFLQIHMPEGKEKGYHTWTISEGDVIGLDYVAVPFDELDEPQEKLA